jgi:ABC-type transporter Mla maintaining outer membrane lipid asymmetry permease subunit MlaE
MTLTVAVVCLTLFAYACGLLTGVLATQAWYEHRADELAGQALGDDEEGVR